MIRTMKLFEGRTDRLKTKVYTTREEMGSAAAADCAAVINRLLATKKTINIIFAAAPSQNEFLAALLESGVDFSSINAFHMDEYIGLPADAPQGFGNFLKAHIFNKAPFASVNCIDCTATDPEAECSRYSALLTEYPPDIVCMGIGENGHIAFNDPGTGMADFKDPFKVKPVTLDHVCRQQQVNDGCFKTIDDVPKKAITLTVPMLVSAAHIFCVVPGTTKEKAVNLTLNGKISESCPASALRLHRDATLYCDQYSGMCTKDIQAYD